MKNRKVLVGMMLVASMAFMACGKADQTAEQTEELPAAKKSLASIMKSS